MGSTTYKWIRPRSSRHRRAGRSRRRNNGATGRDRGTRPVAFEKHKGAARIRNGVAGRLDAVENAHGTAGVQREAQAPRGRLAQGQAAGVVGERGIRVVAHVGGGRPCVEAAGGLGGDSSGGGGGAGAGGIGK